MARFSLRGMFVGVAVVGLAIAAVLNASLVLCSVTHSLLGLFLAVCLIKGFVDRSPFLLGVGVMGLTKTIMDLPLMSDPDDLLSNMVIEATLKHAGYRESDRPQWSYSLGMLQMQWTLLLSLCGGMLAKYLAKVRNDATPITTA